MLNQIPDDQFNTIKLWYLVQHSLSAFRKLETYFGSIQQAIQAENLARWSELKIHKSHIERANEYLSSNGEAKFQICIDKIKQHTDFILLDTDPHYPQQLLAFDNHPPILFGKGSFQNLSQPQIAIVGSRKPSPHGKQVAYDFAYYLSEKGFFITSGLAQGIDEAAHMGGLKNHRTIAVIGTGLDLIYPSQNKHVQEQILQNSGTVITEYLPETQPIQRNFPYRNRIVSGLSLGVLVAEAQLGSGSLITAQTAAEQGKIIFAIPGHIYGEHHQGCHQLIREGAILVDHPEQIVEDLALPTQWHCEQHVENTEKRTEVRLSPEIPAHLFSLYQLLDWIGQDLDSLVEKSQLNTAELTSYLMELELLGLCIQQFGRYLRCRASH
ncbi:DNA-protecting protein DprA [Acinetobacter wuhouensis]|uniref:DNA-processing protein DprA n=1 Tax=Acinetobacter wuhouensis TaxID=1879050 RepID=UPI00083B811D|nr:DNA-processing protein DprA [Acinetobacter wuhouensis]AXQ23817.1 DNA-protecting protein DprA [Acinetobacter wuhouensis]